MHKHPNHIHNNLLTYFFSCLPGPIHPPLAAGDHHPASVWSSAEVMVEIGNIQNLTSSARAGIHPSARSHVIIINVHVKECVHCDDMDCRLQFSFKCMHKYNVT